MDMRPSRRRIFAGGLFDEQYGQIYAAATRWRDEISPALHSIEALDAYTGNRVWETDCQGSPCELVGRSVAVVEWRQEAQLLEVVLLDRQNGTMSRRFQLRLPAWTALPGAHITITEARAEDQTLKIFWHGVATYAGGAPPPREIEAAARRNESGGFTLDIESGKEHPLEGGEMTDMPPASSTHPTSHPLEESTTFELDERTEEAQGKLPQGSRTVTLLAKDRHSGRVLWRHKLRDLIWRPPPPPPT
jgi:hypothetical protein